MSATVNFYELPSALGIAQVNLALHSLLGTLYNLLYRRNLSQNDYPNFKNQTVCFFYPSTNCQLSTINCQLTKGTRFLYYFCLCKSFKELFLLPSNFGKRVQRYGFFPNHQNFSGKIFIFYALFLPLLIHIKTQNGLHLII